MGGPSPLRYRQRLSLGRIYPQQRRRIARHSRTGRGETQGTDKRKRAEGMRNRSLEKGSLIFLRYMDHVLFKDIDPCNIKPWTRETVGWLDYEDPHYVRIVWERFAMPDPPKESKPRATGLVILKKAIIE